MSTFLMIIPYIKEYYCREYARKRHLHIKSIFRGGIMKVPLSSEKIPVSEIKNPTAKELLLKLWKPMENTIVY